MFLQTDFSVDDGRNNIPTQQLKVYLDSLVEEVTRGSIIEVSRRGGMYPPDEGESIEFGSSNIPVYYGLKDGQINIEHQTIENELCEYILDEFPSEMDLSFLEAQGFNYSFEDSISCYADVSDNSVFFEINFPIKVTGEGVSYSISDFEQLIDVNLGQVIDEAEYLLNDISQEINDGNNNINLTDYDLSCNMIRACHDDDGIIELTHYEPWDGNPFLKFNTALDVGDNVLNNKCTKITADDGSKLATDKC